MSLLVGLVVFSGISFLIYGIAYFTSPKMKSEFIRFGLEKFGTLTAILEILGGLGLLVGLMLNFFLLISAGGLALLMLLGVGARLRVKDGFLDTLPALLFFVLNSFIFIESIKIIGD
ncbi:DoxX family protein [Aquiflexum sp.]|uniref:DoxX family protein n=1 Tax=Aquiflexum sp. TaxID=1872584 RepID=UPI0035932DC0